MKMDVDDVDQTLLLQFSCMGTTDKDELVKQLQTLVGYQLNTAAASFFLEMNNWNLQGAVGSYFDAHSVKLPSMSLIRDITAPEKEIWVLPGLRFRKSWEVQNTGDEVWPQDCLLQFTGGRLMTASDQVPFASLPPGGRMTVCLEMIAPDQPGIYESKWRMSTRSGSYFGDVIWIIVTVSNDPPPDQLRPNITDLAQQFSTLTPLGATTRTIALASNPYHNVTSSQPKTQNDAQVSMDEDGNMLC